MSDRENDRILTKPHPDEDPIACSELATDCVMLRWSDIDTEAGLVTVRHGKGGKERVAAILDRTEDTELALQRLRKSQPEGYQFLFASTTPGRGDKVAV